MPLSILAILVVLGIGTIVAIVHMSGLSHEAVITDTTQVKQLLSQDFPEIIISGEAVITSDARAALIASSLPNKLGLVEVFGDRYITRIIDENDIRKVTNNDDFTLAINYSDFTLRKRKYKFADKTELDTAYQLLQNLKDKT